MKKVFIIGRITSTNPVEFLKNCQAGIEIEARLIAEGYNVSHHFLDYNYLLMTFQSITVDHLRECSMDDLKRSDIVLCIGDWRGSKNCSAEWDLAVEIKKPIYYSLLNLLNSESK